MTNPARLLVTAAVSTTLAGALLSPAPTASANPAEAAGVAGSASATAATQGASATAGKLSPRTHFTMNADGSSGRKPDGDAIPNIDSVKKTIATYYGDPGTGYADKTESPYIQQLNRIVERQRMALAKQYRVAIRNHQKPALVFDTDDTLLWTYDMEVAGMHFTFDPALQDEYVQQQKFPAVPAMAALVTEAKTMGFTIFGITGRNDDQAAASRANLTKVGFPAFPAGRYYTKWTGKGDSQKPDYVRCVDASACTTVEYKAGTRRHIEKLGYTITANFGDQWSDLQGGYADHAVKLPNPTYYLPSPNLPGKNQPKLAPRRHFTMKPDGSSGSTAGGEGIPNIDSVKKTIATYYGDPGTGIADKTASPYITQLRRETSALRPKLVQRCRQLAARGDRPAIVLDADDTTLWTYDMEVAAMHFTFDPALQDVWVQDQRFPATPSMVGLANATHRAGCTLIGLTGRNDQQQDATIANLQRVGYRGLTAKNYYTKWTDPADQPGYIHCATTKCTTIEYKSQTRARVETRAGGHYRIVANFGDQYSDLIGGHADRAVKLPNPTYYLP